MTPLLKGCLVVGLVVGLAGCGTVPVQVEKVQVPIAVACLRSEDVPEEPKTASDADLLVMEDRALVLALGRDRERMIAYVAQLRAALRACVGTSTPPGPGPGTPSSPRVQKSILVRSEQPASTLAGVP